jgi:hypothetical protein
MGNVAHMGKIEMHTGLWGVSVTGGDHVGDADINRRIVWSSESRTGKCFCLFVFGAKAPIGPRTSHSRVF